MGLTKRSYDQSRYSSHPVLTTEDLREEHVSTFSLADLDLLVRKVGSKTPPGLPQNQGSFGQRTKMIKWKDAVSWAGRAWKTIYIALSARNKPEFFARHPIDGAPAGDFISEYAKYYCEGKAIKLLKFHTTYLFAAHTKNEVPVAPFDLKGGLPGVLGGGWVYKACHRLMRGRTSDLARATDVLYSKYGMPKASEDFVERTLVAHEKALTTSATLADPYTLVVRKTGRDGVETHDLIPATRAAEKAIKRSIQTVADAIFKDHPFHWRHLVPKPSSCFERNTKNGGQITELVEQFSEWDSRSRPFNGSEFLQLESEYAMFEAKPGEVREYRLSFRKVDMVRRFEDFVCVVAEGRLSDWLNARQFGILEPLKCRVILMAQAVEMYLCTALQRWMHGLMKRVPIFRFIGSPDSLEEIQAVFGDGLGPGEEFVSGDYEAATDNLRGEFSSWAWSCIASSAGLLNQNLVELGHKCLTRHKIFPAQSRKVPDEGHEQKNGQSMGSPMSFPVLCLVNAACWLTVFGEGEHPERLLWNGRVRVNGDDIVYAGPRGFYEPWWSVNTVAGLKPSIGKNYRSERFVNINSHTYELTGNHTADGELVWRSIRSVNTALVQDLVRKGINAGQRTGIPWFSQKANFDYLVKGHRLQTQRNLKSMFLQHVRVPPMIATDLGVVLGGPGFSVGAVSLKARCQTAAALCAKRKDFLLRVPRPEDDSWAGRIVQGLLTERTVSTVIAEQEDPLFAPQWRSETRLCSGDLLAALLDGFTGSGRHSVDCKNPILNPTADHLEGTSGFTQPEFLRKASRYEARVCSWYTDQMNKLFRPGRPTCLFPSDVETTLRYSRQKGFVVKRTLGLDFLSRHPFGGRWLV